MALNVRLPLPPGHLTFINPFPLFPAPTSHKGNRSDTSILHFARINSLNPNPAPFPAPKLRLAWMESCPSLSGLSLEPHKYKVWLPQAGVAVSPTSSLVEVWHRHPAAQPSIIKQHSYSRHLLALAWLLLQSLQRQILLLD